MKLCPNMLPTLDVALKQAEPLDFTAPFTTHINTIYQEDPKKYSDQISTLNSLRSAALSPEKNHKGRDALFSYCYQLELVQNRFPLNDHNLTIHFVWFDAFSQIKVSQTSVAFEKASVIFNLAALCCNPIVNKSFHRFCLRHVSGRHQVCLQLLSSGCWSIPIR